ncbi:MAG: hypothetical protein GQ570_06630 [Helicobacteraceae bacterium]|nr:hypothetical protein [Helicobacteraceae bacterium]
MEDGFEYLKKKDLFTLYEETHISQKNLKLLLEKEFDKINKVQFVGFVSILETQYGLDLSELKNEGLEYYDIHNVDRQQKLFVTTLKERNPYIKIYIVITLATLAVATAVYLFMSQPSSPTVKPDNTNIDKALKNIKINKASQEVRSPIQSAPSPLVEVKLIEKNVTKKPEVNNLKGILINPLQKVWLGIIDIGTHRKNISKVVSKPYEIVGDKDLLISLGHGNIDVINQNSNETTKFRDGGRLRFLYSDHKLVEINGSKFKEINQGRFW